MYIYELSRQEQWAESMLAAAKEWIPADPRGSIDISRAKGGVVRRRLTRNTFERLGLPEAVWLFFEHTDHAFTVETPSEFALELRVAAHVAALRELLRRVFGAKKHL
jgi:murein peptide amidase A